MSPKSVWSGWTVPWSTSMLAEIATSTPAFMTDSAQAVARSAGTFSGPAMRAVVADAGRRRSDAERRHEPVEESVVVVRGEDHHEFRIEVAREVARIRQCRVDVVKELP